jgi:hypothetical protein
MEDLTLPSVGAKWGCYTHTPQRSPDPCNMQGPLKNYKKWFPKKNSKKTVPCFYRRRPTASGRPLTNQRSPAGDRACAGSSLLPPSCPLPPAPTILHMWSILLHWLQHMPALPKFLLKTSNTHNF